MSANGQSTKKAAKWAQLPFNCGEAYDAYDEDENAEPILKKIIMPECRATRTVILL